MGGGRRKKKRRLRRTANERNSSSIGVGLSAPREWMVTAEENPPTQVKEDLPAARKTGVKSKGGKRGNSDVKSTVP